jgi:hypothetical protein
MLRRWGVGNQPHNCQPQAIVGHQPGYSDSNETPSITLPGVPLPSLLDRVGIPPASNTLGSLLFKTKAATLWLSEPPEPDDGQLTQYRSGFLPISRLYRNVRTSTGASRLSDQELDSAFARELQAKWSSYYGDISKEITKAQERGLANILEFFLSGGQGQMDDSDAPDATEAYTRIKGFLDRQSGYSHLLRSKQEFSVLYTKRPELRNVVKQIENIENNIALISAPREKFRRVLESMFTGSKHLVFTDKEIQVQLPTHRYD